MRYLTIVAVVFWVAARACDANGGDPPPRSAAVSPESSRVSASEQPQVQTTCAGCPSSDSASAGCSARPPPAGRRVAPGRQRGAAREGPSEAEQPDQAELPRRDDHRACRDRPTTTTCPLEAIHLIDGDLPNLLDEPRPDAARRAAGLDSPRSSRWSGRSSASCSASVRRAEQPRSTLGWVPLRDGAVEVGRGMPATITIKASRDGRQWETRLRRSHERLAAEARFRVPLRPPGRPSRSGSRPASCPWSRTFSMPSRWPRSRSTIRRARTWPWPPAAPA